MFKVTPAGAETEFYSFSGGADGSGPVSGLIQGTDGNFYGTTEAGGSSVCSYSYPCGTIFKVTPAGVKTVVYSFNGGTDGADPQAALVQGNDGNFYGTTAAGGSASSCGSSECGTIFKVTTAGVENVLYSFNGGTDGSSNDAALVEGADGNFYGTTYGGGNGYGTIFKFTPAGVKTVLYSFSGGTDGANPIASLVQGTDGNFYGTTYGGGNGFGTIFKITPAGAKNVLYSFGGGTDGANPSASLVLGTDGNFYGTTYDGGGTSCSSNAGCGTIFKVTPAGLETVLYSFGGTADGANPASTLVQGTDGNFYGTTTSTVFKLTLTPVS